MDISSFPCTQLVFAFSLGWTLKEVNINGDFNQYIWAFSLGWTQETDVRVTSSSLLISSGKPEEVFPTNIFSVLNECPPLSTEPKLFNTIPTQFLLSPYLGTALQITRVQYARYERFVNQKQEGLVAGVCWCSMTSVKLSADSVDEEKKSLVKAGNDSFWKWSWLTSPSIHGDLKKSRRC